MDAKGWEASSACVGVPRAFETETLRFFFWNGWVGAGTSLFSTERDRTTPLDAPCAGPGCRPLFAASIVR